MLFELAMSNVKRIRKSKEDSVMFLRKLIADTTHKSNLPLNNNSISHSASCLKSFLTKRFSLCFQNTNAFNLLSLLSVFHTTN
jgi:hypothetical protein